MGEKSSCSTTCCLLIIWVGAILLIVYSGIALANDSHKDLTDLCPEEDIWTWLLVMTIVKGLMVIGNFRHREGEKNKTVIVISTLISVLISIGLISWGSIWVFSKCALENLRGTQVWYMSFIHLTVQYVILGLLIVAGIVIGIGMCISVTVSKEQYNESLERV